MAPAGPIIGIDPHKRSHTAVLLDAAEDILDTVRIDADDDQVDRLLAWAPDHPGRVWAVENARGMGHLLSQQLIARGEVVIDVPATLAARARLLSGKSGTKTDSHDARSVAIAATHNRGLLRVTADADIEVLGMLLDRRWQLVSQRHRTICRIHATLMAMTPAGARSRLTPARTVALLRRIRPTDPVGQARRQLVVDMLADWRWLNRRIVPAEEQVVGAVQAWGTGLPDIHGIGWIGAATILVNTGDISRFPTPGHFAAFAGTAPIQASSGPVVRHRLSRRGNRQLNKVLHVAATCQIRNDTPGRTYYQRKIAEGESNRGALRKLKRHIATAVYRQLRADQAVRCGQMETRQLSA